MCTNERYLQLIISDPPLFVHENEILLRQLRQGKDHTLYCNVSSANPPLVHLKLIRPNNTSKNVGFMVIIICSTFQNGHLPTK